ncbi:MAG: tRNA threonylcarbamoyladenosine dehydratase [Bacilli bacterium]|nr:tRNA threonylcarbamoyladenosine dehydratase [Bacilli bacterium]
MELSRLELLTENTGEIAKQNILIIGLGGVGGYALEALVRSGINNITIVDSDKVEQSNLNRQLLALTSTIGKYKTDVAYKRALLINPDINITKVTKYLTPENINEIDFKKFDYVLDACDTVNVKKEIIKICTSNNIKFISCMGTGNKMNPSLLEITDIRKTSYDPLARIIRKMVKDENITAKIPVVCSKEIPIKTNSNIIGSNAFVPATAGLLMASFVINEVIYEKNI